jgi:hypothetical protein
VSPDSGDHVRVITRDRQRGLGGGPHLVARLPDRVRGGGLDLRHGFDRHLPEPVSQVSGAPRGGQRFGWPAGQRVGPGQLQVKLRDDPDRAKLLSSGSRREQWPVVAVRQHRYRGEFVQRCQLGQRGGGPQRQCVGRVEGRRGRFQVVHAFRSAGDHPRLEQRLRCGLA